VFRLRLRQYGDGLAAWLRQVGIAGGMRAFHTSRSQQERPRPKEAFARRLSQWQNAEGFN